MFALSRLTRLTARHVVAVASFAALLTAACNTDSTAPSSPTLSAHGRGNDGGGGASSGFSVLAREAVTCTGGSIIGDVGTFVGPGAPGAITQTPPGCINGALDIGGPAAVAAYNAFLSAYAALAPQPGDVCPIITGTLAGQSFAPGVYCVSAEAKTGVVTLNGPANGIWVFKVAPGAFTGTSFSVVLANGAQACNVTWWVDAAATMTDSDLKGNVLAGAGITLTRGTFAGNAWAGADGVGDVTSTGTAFVGCGGAGPQICRVSGDRVTGGGFIMGTPSGAKGSFGVTGGIRRGAFRGQLEFNDHGSNGPKVKGTGVTAYSALDGVTRRIEGTARMNGQRGFTYQVDVSDNGEPGRNDVFAIRLWNAAGALVYSASGTLRGGNIQLHQSRARSCRDHDDGDDDDDDGDHGDDRGDHGHDDDHEGH